MQKTALQTSQHTDVFNSWAKANNIANLNTKDSVSRADCCCMSAWMTTMQHRPAAHNGHKDILGLYMIPDLHNVVCIIHH